MIDIKQSADGDVDISSGDIQYVESDRQHQRDILLSGKGHYKEYGALGVDVVGFVNDNEPANFLRSVRREFARDGMKVKIVRLVKRQLQTDAAYENDNG